MGLRSATGLTALLIGSVLALPLRAVAGEAANSGSAPVAATAGAQAPQYPAPATPYPYPYPAQVYAPYPSAEYSYPRSSGDPAADLRGLEQRISDQERRVAEQEKRLQEQSGRLDEQSQERHAQMRLIIDQQDTLERQNQELRLLRYQYAQLYALYTNQAGAGTAPVAGNLYGQPRLWHASEVLPVPPTPVPPTPLPPKGGQPATEGQPETPAGEQPVSGENGAAKAAEGERPKSEKPTELLLLEAGGILIPPGRLILEPAIEYDHASGNRVNISGFTIFDAIVIGTIRVDSLEQDIVTSQMTARYGLFQDVQVDFQAPYVYRKDKTVRGVGTGMNVTESTVTGSGIGDMQGTIEWQPIKGHGSVPDTIFRATVRVPTGTSAFEIPTEPVPGGNPGETQLMEAPTGTGFWGAGPGVTVVWRTDPVVLFAGGSYTFNFKRMFDIYGKIDPGDTYEFYGGMNFAINEAVSMNMSFIDQITATTKQNDIESPGTSANDARLILGTSVGLAPNISLLVSAGAGLTDQSPDFTFTVSAPITIDIFR